MHFKNHVTAERWAKVADKKTVEIEGKEKERRKGKNSKAEEKQEPVGPSVHGPLMKGQRRLYTHFLEKKNLLELNKRIFLHLW